MKDFDKPIYDIFRKKFNYIGNKRYLEINSKSEKIVIEVHNNFHLIIQNKNEYAELLQSNFEIEKINFGMFLDKKDINIVDTILKYLNDILNNNFEHLLINCERDDIEGLIFKIKNDMIISNNTNKNHWIFKDNQEYETNIIKFIFKKIAPLFCQYILISLISYPIQSKSEKYEIMKNIIIDLYKQSNYTNFLNYFKNVDSKRYIIYTFSKNIENLFKEIGILENKYGKFDEQSISYLSVESLKKEDDLILEVKTFLNYRTKQILMILFSEKDLANIYNIYIVIENLEKEYPKLNDKIIIFIIHKESKIKKENINNQKQEEHISLINDKYNQIFIDNLTGKYIINIFDIVDKNNNSWKKQYLVNSNFIDEQIHEVLSYMKFYFVIETKELNNDNFIDNVSRQISKNNTLKNLILNSLVNKTKNIKILPYKENENNIEDYFINIENKIKYSFTSQLTVIVYYLLKYNILLPFIHNFNILEKNENLLKKIKEEFNKEIHYVMPKMEPNSNKVNIYYNIKIPKSIYLFKKLIAYIKNELYMRFLKTENELRKNTSDDEISNLIKKYFKEINLYEENIKNEIIKYEIFNNLSKELKLILVEDYLYYCISCFFEAEKIECKLANKIHNFLKLILQIKIGDKFIYENEHSSEDFEKIILFIQGYNDDIKNIIKLLVQTFKYCSNIDEKIISAINENKSIYEMETRKHKENIQIVNNIFFYIIESFIQCLLNISSELVQKDNIKFKEFFNLLNEIKITFKQMNIKFGLFSKGIIHLEILTKMKEKCISNYEYLVKNYVKIIENLLLQNNEFYQDNDNRLYELILEEISILNEIFIEKNDEYTDLLLFIFKLYFSNLQSEEFKIKLIEYFIENKLILKNSKLLLSLVLSDMKPKEFVFNNEEDKSFLLIKDFLNPESKQMNKFKKLITLCDNINSSIFNEVLLYFFEGQCQSYFTQILKENNNNYSEKCCQQLLNNLSLSYFKKSILYLDEHYSLYNNIFKLYAIAYIKTYCKYYVEINYKYFDLCNFNEINKILLKKNENNKFIRDMITLYICRLYYKNFENFEQFKNYNFSKLAFWREIKNKILCDDSSKYIFQYNFINSKTFIGYGNVLIFFENFLLKKNFDVYFINDNFDLFYSVLVNRYISFLYGNEKLKYINIMKEIYNATYQKIKLDEEGKALYKYLMDYDLLEQKILNKISETPLTQNEFEILLYSLKFIFNTQALNKKCFYNSLLKKGAKNFIDSNYIPGSFPYINEYEKSYNKLLKELPLRLKIGYYICKDCGYLYEIYWCCFPLQTSKCPNGHIIGGKDNICYKKDLRIFENQKNCDEMVSYWKQCYDWINSYQTVFLKDFKEKYVDKQKEKIDKGINKDFDIIGFENKLSVRNMHTITYRLLNYLLYSYLLGSYILANLEENYMKEYLVENLFPHTLFGIIKKNWELLSDSLKKIGIENNQIFINSIFEKVIDIISKYDSFDTVDKMLEFENVVNKFILKNIEGKNISNLISEYEKLNNNIMNISPNSYKEKIMENYDPLIYDQKIYPDIQYFSVSKIENINTFREKFNSSKENKTKYILINTLIQKDEDLNKNIINMNCLNNINKLSNLLITKYDYKISREQAKKLILKNELTDILNYYNLIYGKNIDKEEFRNNVIKPFILSCDLIKEKATKYKCKVIRDLEKGENPFCMNIDSPLSDFLVDDGEINGGMFLASAYENMIFWQNNLLNLIIEKNKINGPLNQYISGLEQTIDIQEASSDEILNIDENIYKYLEKLILQSSMRNIFQKKDKINYRNYNDIIYDFDYIEQELAKLILSGKKRFTTNIKFIKYLYEGFEPVFIENKYGNKKLNEQEEKLLYDFIKNNKNNCIYSDIYSSILIIIESIIKENYNPKLTINNIIMNLPNYIHINKIFKNFLSKNDDNNNKYYLLENIFTIFEIFEALCWNEIKSKICMDYKINISEEEKKRILEYFEDNNIEGKIVNKNNLTLALRKLISRNLVGSREDMNFRNDLELKYLLIKSDLWDQNIIEKESDNLENELNEILSKEIKVGNAYDLYNILNGDYLFKINIEEKIFGENLIKGKSDSENDMDNSEESDESEEKIREFY